MKTWPLVGVVTYCKKQDVDIGVKQEEVWTHLKLGSRSRTLGRMTMEQLVLLGELVLRAGLRRSMSSAVSCCWIGSAKDTRLD